MSKIGNKTISIPNEVNVSISGNTIDIKGPKGNEKINKNCGYCEFKKECYKDSNDGKGLRVFNYAKGPLFLATVKSEPKVEELYEW